MSDRPTARPAKRRPVSRRGHYLQKFKDLRKIPYSDGFDPREMERLRLGLEPDSEKEKWIVYFEKNKLCFHRADTGQGIYQIRIKTTRSGWGEVKWAKACKTIMVVDKHYEAAILDFLIAHLLLGHDIAFPRHEKIDQDRKGEFQQNIAGTDQPEKVVAKKNLKGLFK